MTPCKDNQAGSTGRWQSALTGAFLFAICYCIKILVPQCFQGFLCLLCVRSPAIAPVPGSSCFFLSPPSPGASAVSPSCPGTWPLPLSPHPTTSSGSTQGGSGKRGGWSGGRDIGYTPHILQPMGETGRGKTGGRAREKGLKIFGEGFREVFRFDLVGNLW